MNPVVESIFAKPKSLFQSGRLNFLVIYVLRSNVKIIFRKDAVILKGPLTDFFEPLLGKIYSHITSSFLVTSELFHVF